MPSKSALLADWVLRGAFLFFFLAFLYALFLSELQEFRWKLLYSAVSLAGLVLYSISLRWQTESKVNFALVTTSIFLSVYLAEIIIALFSPHFAQAERMAFDNLKTAESAGMPYDSRTKLEVLRDLRGQGVDAWPLTGAKVFMKTDGLVSAGKRVYPLAMVSRSTIVDCNDSGVWSIFKSDEHGFRNPRGLYREGHVDLVLIGDAFAQGSCVMEGEDVASQLRQAGFRALTLGVAGDGPLAELGTLTEYGRMLGPKVVLWMYWEGNDAADLSKEQRIPTVLRYLDDNFSQNLIEKQDLIDRSLKAYMTAEEKKERQVREQGVLSKIRFSPVLRLWHLRKNLLEPLRPSKFPDNSDLLSRIFAKANERVRNWGGKLYVIYLPAVARYASGDESHDLFAHRALILTSVRRLGLPIIDFTEVLNQHSDPLSVFPFRRTIHYTAEGYKLLGDAILTRLEIDGIVPLPVH